MFTADDGFATYVVACFADHGIEPEIAHIDAVPNRGCFSRKAACGNTLNAHDIDRVGGAVYQTGDIVEVVSCAVVFDVIVAATVCVDCNLHVVEADAAANYFVEGAIATAGIESDILAWVLGAPFMHPSGGITGGEGVINLVVELAV